MKINISLRWLLAPLLLMAVAAAVLMLENSGIQAGMRDSSIGLLPYEAISAMAAEPSRLLILDSGKAEEAEYAALCKKTLEEMRLPYIELDAASEKLETFDGVNSIIYCTSSLQPLGELIQPFTEWLENGGHIAFMQLLETDDVFSTLYRQLGITEYSSDYGECKTLKLDSQLFPYYTARAYSGGGSFDDVQARFRLDGECTVHMTAEEGMPALWEHTNGKGRVVVLNSAAAHHKDSRGLASAAIALAEDAVAYPIINGAAIFFDDFPAPQPEDYNKKLLDDYGYDIKGFFRNHWWPDMEKLDKKYGVEYTGVLVETYNDNVFAPFDDEGDHSLLRFYGMALLQTGGEIGLHGYNHIPLCPVGFKFSGEDYGGWPAKDNMIQSLRALYAFGSELFPEAVYTTYVPPSNYLSEKGREALLETIPSLRVISGVYLDEEGVDAYVQEFMENADGIVDVPRISSGFITGDYEDFVIAQELELHGVFSHFVHPDDVLDEERGALSGWEKMYGSFDGTLGTLFEKYPQLRKLTATELAGAVQRYCRLRVEQRDSEEKLELTLENFVDEAWLAVKTHKLPAGATGGELFKIYDGCYWLRADSPDVVITWEAA